MALTRNSDRIVPRDYQSYCNDQLLQYFNEKRGQAVVGCPLVAMPTGTGKSLVPPMLVKSSIDLWGDIGNVVLLTHVKELVAQNAKAFAAYCPEVPVGVVSAGLNMAEFGRTVTVAGIASVCKQPQRLGKVGLLLVDEAHSINHKDEGMYRDTISVLRQQSPYMRVGGLTATPFRMGGGTLLDGDTALFTDIAVDMTETSVINWFMQQGYLVPLIEKRPSMLINVDGVGTTGGDFNPGQLQEACTREGVTENALHEVMFYGQTRRKWLLFCSGIEHAEQAAAWLNVMGIPTGCVHSKMKDAERDRLIADYRAGRYRAMTNNGVLTTGFDDPAIDLIVGLRPTKSAGLWVQMLGRGTRPIYVRGFDLRTQEGRIASILASPKHNCLVMDFAGNVARCGPFNDPMVPKAKGKGTGDAPVRLCKLCNCYSHASAKFCVACGAPFPVDVKITSEASTQAIMTDGDPNRQPSSVPVSRVEYSRHKKEGGYDSVCVTYYAGVTRFRAWWCFEHTQWPRYEAVRNWRKAGGQSPPPSSVTEALSRIHELRTPVQLRVWPKGKFYEVIDVAYEG